MGRCVCLPRRRCVCLPRGRCVTVSEHCMEPATLGWSDVRRGCSSRVESVSPHVVWMFVDLKGNQWDRMCLRCFITLVFFMAKKPPPMGFPCGSDGKESACNVGMSIPGSTTSPGEGHGSPLQYSCLQNPMDRGAWWAVVHGVANSWTRLSN